MDCVIPTNDRPSRLACTLSTLLLQQGCEPRRLYLVDNSERGVCEAIEVKKAIRALQYAGWDVVHRRSEARSITAIKMEALRCGNDPYLVLIDNDILFLRSDTVASLEAALDRYQLSAVSPVAFDLDEDRAVLGPYIDAYDRYPPNRDGLLEATVALGTCIAMNRRDVEEVLSFFRWELPYMEDQAIAHFLKQKNGYAYLRDHAVLHCGYKEQPSYVFDDLEVVQYLETLCAQEDRYCELLELRRACRDGADFPRGIPTN